MSKNSEACLARRAWLKSKGYCVQCGCVKARPGKTTCWVCGERVAEQRKKAYQAKKAAGVCVVCGCHSSAVEGKTMCEKHLAALRERSALGKKARRADEWLT